VVLYSSSNRLTRPDAQPPTWRTGGFLLGSLSLRSLPFPRQMKVFFPGLFSEFSFSYALTNTHICIKRCGSSPRTDGVGYSSSVMRDKGLTYLLRLTLS
ncbi:hypothetical protein L9F63_002875, partial [Diploptera punctata]